MRILGDQVAHLERPDRELLQGRRHAARVAPRPVDQRECEDDGEGDEGADQDEAEHRDRQGQRPPLPALAGAPAVDPEGVELALVIREGGFGGWPRRFQAHYTARSSKSVQAWIIVVLRQQCKGTA
jgi:hypothetical protein